MLTKQVQIVKKVVEVEEEVTTYNLQLTKDQLLELTALLGNCNTQSSCRSLYGTLIDEVTKANQYDRYENMVVEIGEMIHNYVPQLKYL